MYTYAAHNILYITQKGKSCNGDAAAGQGTSGCRFMAKQAQTHTHTCTLHTMHTGKSCNGDAAAENGTSGCCEFVKRVCECGVG